MEGGWDEDMKIKEKDLMGQLEAREKQDAFFWQQRPGSNACRRVKEMLNFFITQ